MGECDTPNCRQDDTENDFGDHRTNEPQHHEKQYDTYSDGDERPIFRLINGESTGDTLKVHNETLAVAHIVNEDTDFAGMR